MTKPDQGQPPNPDPKKSPLLEPITSQFCPLPGRPNYVGPLLPAADAAAWDTTVLFSSSPSSWATKLAAEVMAISPTGYIGMRSPAEAELAQEILELKQQLDKEVRGFQIAEKRSKEAEKQLEQAKRTNSHLLDRLALQFILTRIHGSARELLLGSAEFKQKFLSGHPSNSYVLSVDIRRSTELMLKARQPELFARFLSELCVGLEEVVHQHHGVFDKFTGDGVMAFFPEFYSGTDAGYYAVAAAAKCHEVFSGHYRASRNCFSAVLKNTGLGIGIDHGPTHLVQVGGGLTVVGTPVVYACRMAAANAGATLLNQPAYEKIFERFSAYCSFEESEIEVKNEGTFLGYAVKLNGKPFGPARPAWQEYGAVPGTPSPKQQ